MTDNRKACEEMADALLEELSTRIGLSRLRAEKDATHHGSQENLKVGMKPGLKAKLSSTAWLQSSEKQSRAGREMGRGAKKGDSPENKCGDQEKV